MLGMVDDFREAGTVGKDAGCQHPLPNVWQEPLDEVILQVCHIGGRERPWIVGWPRDPTVIIKNSLEMD